MSDQRKPASVRACPKKSEKSFIDHEVIRAQRICLKPPIPQLLLYPFLVIFTIIKEMSAIP